VERILLEEYTWAELKQMLENDQLRTVVITVGSTEQHGQHLPECTDSLLAQAIGEGVVRKLDRALLAPPIRVGCSEHHTRFSATISLRKETMAALLSDYVDSLAHHGFRNIVLVPTHGGNFGPVGASARTLRAAHPAMNIIDYTNLNDLMQMSYAASAEFGVDSDASGGHAGEWETSLILALRPELVHMDKAVQGCMNATPEMAPLVFREGIGVLDKNGILGDPRSATAEKGRVYLERAVDAIAAYVNERIR
jgi:creatinine amidohydrolase